MKTNRIDNLSIVESPFHPSPATPSQTTSTNAPTAGPAVPLCFTSLDGTTTYTSSVDSRAVRDAASAASSGGTVHIAGYCAGTSGGQLVNINKGLTLIGGYEAISGTGVVTWSVQDFGLYSTTLDASRTGRVIVANQPLTLSMLVVQNGSSFSGGGVSTSAALTLTNIDIISNTASDEGGGISISAALVISNSNFLSNTAHSAGGAVRVVDTSVIATIENTLFQGNRATINHGGGIYAFNAQVAITDSQLSGNTASVYGGGMYVGGLLTKASLLNRTTFSSNTAGQNGGGASIGSSVDLIETTFQSNTTTSANGGGLYVLGSANLTGTTFLSNTAKAGFGGGVWISDTAKITGSLFLDNVATNAGGGAFVIGFATVSKTTFQNNRSGDGAGLCAAGSATINETTFANNIATQNGGGASVEKAAQVSDVVFHGNTAQLGGGLYLVANTNAPMNVFNNRFSRNQSTAQQGNALYLEASKFANVLDVLHNTIVSPTIISGTAIHILSGTINISNTIIASNTIGIRSNGGSVKEDYNLFFGTINDRFGSVATGGHSLSGDPAFVDGVNDDYQLSPLSAAIDAGTDSAIGADFFGDTRPQQAAADIGFDESPYLTPLPKISNTTNQSTNEDTPTSAISVTVSDLQTAADQLILSASSSVTTLVPIANITFGGSGSSRTVTINPAADRAGTAVITLTITDGDGLRAVDTFTLTVTPVADTPSVTGTATHKNAQTPNGLVITRNPSDGNEVTHVKITNISHGTLFLANGVTVIPDNSFITFSQANAGLKFTPTTNFTGTASFMVQAAIGNNDAGLGGNVVTATIDVIENTALYLPVLAR